MYMYRIIFKHHPKKGQEEAYVKQWQKGSDVIQKQPGARGTKLFLNLNDPGFFYAMAEWESKDLRDKAIENIKNNNPDHEEILHKHTTFVDKTETLGEFELIAESNPS